MGVRARPLRSPRARRISRAILVAVGLTALVAAAPARAATVLIVGPGSGPPAIVETLVRLKGELTSAGFDTEIVDEVAVAQSAGGDWRAGWEQLAAARGADAVVAIIGNLSPDLVEVWVIDKVTGKSVVRRVPFEPTASRASGRLAIRAIELLRSSFLEIDLSARDRRDQGAGAPPPAVVRFVEQARLEGRPERFGLGVGGAAVASLDGVGPAVLPLVHVDWSLRSWLRARATLAGLGTRPIVQSAAGSAQVAQAYGLVGAGIQARGGQRWRPFVVLAAGVLHTSIAGRADPPNQGHTIGRWSLLIDGGVGTLVRLPDRFFVSVSAHAQLARPYLAVRFVDTVVATSARPNIALAFTIGAWL